MRVLVTGADGFVAQSLIPMLFEKNHSLCLIGKDIELINKLYGVSVNNHSYIDLDQSKLIAVIEKFQPEIVVHLAAYSTAYDEYDDMQKMFSANLLFLGRILDALKYITLKLFIYTGSSTEFAKGDNDFDPSYLYAATKTAGRVILKYYSDVYNFKTISIVPYNIYGHNDTRKKVLDLIYDSLESVSTIDLTLGNQVLDFIHVEDVARLYISVIETCDNIPGNKILYAGTGVGYSLREIATLMENIYGGKASINWGGKNYRIKDTMFSVADISETTEVCKWKPLVTINEGLKKFIKQRKE